MKSAHDNPLLPVAELKNLGPKSAAWLNAVGIYTLADLKDTGPLSAYLKVKLAGYNSSLNLLYALVGAIEDLHWTAIKRQQKHDLVLALDALLQDDAVQK